MNVSSTNNLRPDMNLDQTRNRSSSSQPASSRRSSSTTQHPPFFGANFATVLAQSFNCCFSPIACEDDPPLPLSLYIEHIIRAAGLPFEVGIASLILLQRMYMHLMPKVFDRRADFSPYRLFACAYVLAAKQHEHLRNSPGITERTRINGVHNEAFSHGTRPISRSPTTSPRMSNVYWAQVTGYTCEELENMQHQFIRTLGRSVVVFQIPGRQEREYAEKLDGCPLMRGLPINKQPALRNLARMTTEEQYAYFSNMGTVAALHAFQGAGQPSRREVCEWWQNRARSYP